MKVFWILHPQPAHRLKKYCNENGVNCNISCLLLCHIEYLSQFCHFCNNLVSAAEGAMCKIFTMGSSGKYWDVSGPINALPMGRASIV